MGVFRADIQTVLFYEYAFLFGFLPVVLLAYYGLPGRWRNGWLFLASCLFYAASSLEFLPLLLASVAVDYSVGVRLAKATDPAARKRWLALSVGVNLGLLGAFKYGGFLTGSLRSLFQTDGIPLVDLVLPIGISFYTFQSMSYTIDLYRGRTRPVDSIVDFAAYVTMFPQLVAGPIVRFSHLNEQLKAREHSVDRFASGLHRFILGMAKKLLIADTLAALSVPLFANANPGFLEAWLSMLLFAGQIYFDFSGYSDMAIGLGRLFGFELPENFDAPYRATSFSDFWRRWHITLSSWLRDYLYIPLGGNRSGTIRTFVNLAITMLLGGLWHGASWNFVLWGGLHGLALGVERTFRERGPSLPRWIRRGIVFVCVILIWTPFKLESAGSVFVWWNAMAGGAGLGQAPLLPVLGALAFLGLVWGAPVGRPRLFLENPDGWPAQVASCALLIGALFVGYGRLDPSPFLYFRF